MSFIIDPELLYSLTYAPDDGDGEGAGGGGDEGEGDGAEGSNAGGDEGDGSGEGEGDEGEGESDKLAPELEELVSARIAKALLEREEASAAEREAEAAEHEFDSRILETDGKVEQAMAKANAAIVANAKNLRVLDANGAAIALTEAQIDQLVFDPLNELLETKSAAQVAEAMDEYSAAYLATIPAEAHEGYLKNTVDKQLTPAAHAQAYAEAMAPFTKAWKHREGEFADERATAVAAATNKGFEAGKSNPGQMASQQGTKGTGGKLTSASFLAMSAEEQAKVYAERREEVEALS